MNCSSAPQLKRDPLGGGSYVKQAPMRIAVLGGTVAVTVLSFWILLQIDRPGWETHEYPALIFWTAPPALLLALLAGPIRSFLLRRSIVIRIVIPIVVAPLFAYGWLWVAYYGTGGYVLAFDANPLWCWTAGAVAGLLLLALWPK